MGRKATLMRPRASGARLRLGLEVRAAGGDELALRSDGVSGLGQRARRAAEWAGATGRVPQLLRRRAEQGVMHLRRRAGQLARDPGAHCEGVRNA